MAHRSYLYAVDLASRAPQLCRSVIWGELDDAAKRAVDALVAVRSRVESAIAWGEAAWLEELRAHWETQLGIDNWSEDLYYSFS